MAMTDSNLKAIGPRTNADDPRAPHAGDDARPPHSLTVHPRRDSRRVLAGFVLLLIAGVAALNVVLFRNASQRAERDGWKRLEASADLRRDQIAAVVGAFRREALGTVEDPVVHQTLVRIARRPEAGLDADGRREVMQAIARFGFSRVQVADSLGHVLFQAGAPGEGAVFLEPLVRRTLSSGADVLGDPLGSQFSIAVPLDEGTQPAEHAVVFHAREDGSFLKLLGRWPGMGPSSRAYLVRPEGDRVVVLTGAEATTAQGFTRGQRLPLAAPEATVPAMAATRIESRADARDTQGRTLWAVTRTLPEFGWGLVATESRADAMTGLGSTWGLLLVLDFGLVVFVLGLAMVWRRLYANALARREAEITERHGMRMRAVFDTAFDGILMLDRRGRVRSANRAAATLFGRGADEIEGLPLPDILQWGRDGSDGWLPATGSVAHGHVRRPDGIEIPVEFSVGHAGSGDELLHTAIVRDVRERVEAERLVRESAAGLESSNRRLEEVNAQLEEASRLKSEFLANTSHELRTPLNGMIGFLQLVLDGLCDSPDEERDYLRQALACSRHLLGLINDVLDIAKIEAGKLTLEIERLDVQRVFDEVYTLTHVQAAQRGVELVFDVDLEAGAAARGDFGKTKQVLVNLVGNSLKFTPRGRVTVRARSRASLGHVIFEVQDTGVGIPAERQKLIFEKFVQGDGSTTRRFGGTGLGLAISRSLVELMGGIIGVHSDGENQGTRMYFSLPLWRGEAGQAEEAPAGHGVDRIEGLTGGSLVLVVEDDPVSRRLLTAVLQQSGYRTIEAENAESAWVLVRRLHPACIVLDYALSCSDGATLRTGWDLAQRLTTERETRHIPLVFVTGFDGELREKLRSTAFARKPEHLVKPIDPRHLIARIDALVGPQQDRVVRVLMADDDATVAAYVRKVLPADRFHVEIANNGEECLHVLRTQPRGFDILLLDLMMPEVSGYDVLREMTLSGLSPDLPVLVLTNFPEPRDESERQLLEQGLVIEIIPKTEVHAHPHVLPAALHRHVPGLAVPPRVPDERREAA
jgi:PAS domain S-box-containing protein